MCARLKAIVAGKQETRWKRKLVRLPPKKPLTYDPKHPQVCMDETSKQLVSEVTQPIPASPGQVERYDYEYERNGVANLFILFEPLSGWRHVKVTERRTKQDWALLMKELVDVHYPTAETIRLVLDNLNTHVASSLYETFEPAEAKRILNKLEFHYTPKLGKPFTGCSFA